MPVAPPAINTVAPANLDKKFMTHSTYKHMTATEAKAKIDSKEWKDEQDHPQIIQELTSEQPPKVSIEILAFEFDIDLVDTNVLVEQFNGLHITSNMKLHVLSIKKTGTLMYAPQIWFL